MRHLRLIGILAGRNLRALRRRPATLAVMLLPLLGIYTLIALVFGETTTPPVEIAVLDEDGSGASRELVAALEQKDFDIVRVDPDATSFAELRAAVRGGERAAALRIAAGFADARAAGPGDPGLELLLNGEDPPRDRAGLLAAVELAAARGERADAPRASVEVVSPERTPEPPLPLLYVATLVPMFLLFNSQGTATAFLGEISGGTTRRLLAAPISTSHVLLGQMAYGGAIAVFECVVLYVYAWAVFGAPVWPIAHSLLVMAAATSTATVGFGVLLTSIVRNAEQLGSLGTVAVLAMSAVGGSVIPRIYMPEWLQGLGLLTINGWAIDGFLDVVGEGGLLAAVPEIAVLIGLGAVFAAAGSALLRPRLTEVVEARG